VSHCSDASSSAGPGLRLAAAAAFALNGVVLAGLAANLLA
jgi:hypothetical protein